MEETRNILVEVFKFASCINPYIADVEYVLILKTSEYQMYASRATTQQPQNLDRCSIQFPKGFLQPFQRKVPDIILPARGQS